ncbi:MAG: hypothetical protein NUV63_12095 [Gallionella sp.]|nr:hypothetical protein [Gallionella sp.]
MSNQIIADLRKNCMGTVSFNGKFAGMRKAQNFIVYPMHSGNSTESALVQSNTRIGRIHLTTGEVLMSPSRQGGSYNVHLMLAKPADALSAEELLLFKSAIFATADGKAGNNAMHVFTDNSAALEVFGQVQ